MKKSPIFRLSVIASLLHLLHHVNGQTCNASCILPSCSCSRFEFPMNITEIPQMVYFAFDDAVHIGVSRYYDKLFTKTRTNPNGCVMPMTLFISHQYTDYSLVKQYYDKGHEIAVHSVTHTNIVTDSKLKAEAKAQKKNLINAGIPKDDIIGWKSPFLKTAGENEPSILKALNYTYEISLSYRLKSLSDLKPWPFTLHDGWPYTCSIPPCPTNARVDDFWAVPVVSMMMNRFPCVYVDGCHQRPGTANGAYQFLMSNFMSYYKTNKAPFGLHMHAAWFAYPHHLEGTIRFLNELMRYDDVYIVTVKQMLAWMKQPTTLSRIHTLMEWHCEESLQNIVFNTSSTSSTSSITSSTKQASTTTVILPNVTSNPNMTITASASTTTKLTDTPIICATTSKPHRKTTTQQLELTTFSPISKSSTERQLTTTNISTTTEITDTTTIHTPGQCNKNCILPNCSCSRFEFPMNITEIPQMVYFAFDDAVHIGVSRYYDKLFTKTRTNPNGCVMPMTLFISHQYTDYSLVKQYYDKGHEIAVHSVTHTNIVTDSKLKAEAKAQKKNLINAGIPKDDIIGWRSPFLKTAGENEPSILKALNYTYEISLSYRLKSLSDLKPWPFTLHDGWPYTCSIPPCPTNARVDDFWAVPVISVMMNRFPCVYIDGCHQRPGTANGAYQFLMSNFMSYYKTNKAPFGLHMHAAWFAYPHHLEGTIRFLNELMRYDDVYIVTVKQMLTWMKQPTPLSRIHTLMEWQCE